MRELKLQAQATRSAAPEESSPQPIIQEHRDKPLTLCLSLFLTSDTTDIIKWGALHVMELWGGLLHGRRQSEQYYHHLFFLAEEADVPQVNEKLRFSP